MDFPYGNLVTARSGRKYISLQSNIGMRWMAQGQGQQMVLRIPLTPQLPLFLVLPHTVVILLLRPALLPLVLILVLALGKFVLTCPHGLSLNRMSLVILSLACRITHLPHDLAYPLACPHKLLPNRMTMMIFSLIRNIIRILTRSFAHPLVHSFGRPLIRNLACPPARRFARHHAHTPTRRSARHLTRNLAHQCLLPSTSARPTPYMMTMELLIRQLSMFPQTLKGVHWLKRGWCVIVLQIFDLLQLIIHQHRTHMTQHPPLPGGLSQ